MTRAPLKCPKLPPVKPPPHAPATPAPKPTKTIKILTWGAQNMGKPFNETWFQRGNEDPFQVCYDRHFKDPSIRCTITNDRSQINVSDVVLFRARRLDELPLPTRPSPKQKWVFFEVEPPYKVYEFTNLTKYKDVFNLSATYSSESDFPHLIDLKKCHVDEKKLQLYSKMNFAANKTRNVAWFATNCKSQSKREQYIKEMQSNIGVDIYGKCGNLSCGTNYFKSWSEAKCHETLFNYNNSYRFYLAFENSLCYDYLTEKLWKLKGYSVIPIVMGLADYKNMLPEKSFIDVTDFESPQKLAEFLLKLSKNDELYNEYVARWRSLECEPWYPPYSPWQCKICEGLHKLDGRTQIIHDIARFWGSRKCLTPSMYFQSAALQNEHFNVTFH
jgi:hypothetical protein